MAQEITQQVKTVSMMSAQKTYISSISNGMIDIIGKTTDYQRLCGYNILNQINLALSKEGLTHQSPNVDKETINNAIKFAMIYGLNTDNKEVFTIVRNEKRKDNYVKVVEVKPQYKGTLKIIAEYGKDVECVYPEWIVREGDDFTYQTFKGVDVIPPSWTPKSCDGKVLRVIVPIKRKNGFIDYRIAERESVATNIKAQIKQSVMFNQNKDKILALMKDMTLDELLNNAELRQYVNETYTGISQEEMIITKLVLNAVKRVAIDYKNAFMREITETTFDNADVYKRNHCANDLLEQEKKLVELNDTTPEIELQEEPKVVEEQKEPIPATKTLSPIKDINDKELAEYMSKK